MSERTAENRDTTVPDLLEEEEDKSRGEGEGEEKVNAQEEGNEAAFLTHKPEQMQEDNKERAGLQVSASKNKPGKVQSVFCLVREQIRGQPGHEPSRTGMLRLVQHVTRQLEKTKAEQGGLDDTSPKKEIQETLEVQKETVVDLEVEQTKEEEEHNKDECVILLHEILNSIEGLRKDVGEELNLLRQESRSNMDKVLQELETRLKHSLNTNTHMNTPLSVPPPPPPPGAPKKRVLRRTLTTLVPKTSTAQAFRPRCLSEPVGGRKVECVSVGNGVNAPTSSLEPLLPSIVVTQHAKKPVRSKPRNKPASSP